MDNVTRRRLSNIEYVFDNDAEAIFAGFSSDHSLTHEIKHIMSRVSLKRLGLKTQKSKDTLLLQVNQASPGIGSGELSQILFGTKVGIELWEGRRGWVAGDVILCHIAAGLLL